MRFKYFVSGRKAPKVGKRVWSWYRFGLGKTGGRGSQRSVSFWRGVRRGFEGSQDALYRRSPKFGFTS